MDKSSILMILMVVFFIGCGAAGDWKTKRDDTIKAKITTKLYTVTHDGHKLIVYSDYSSYAGMGGLMHHPDCPCLKNE